MSKMSELDPCIGELRTAAQSLVAVADSLTALFGASAAPAVMFTQSGNGNVQMTNADPVNIEDGKVKAAKSSTPKPKPVTLEQVRAVLAEKSRCGHTAKVRELLQKHGAAKLSEIDRAEFESLLSEAAAIGLGEGEDG
jgi:uncharacterized protein (DUF111 family)